MAEIMLVLEQTNLMEEKKSDGCWLGEPSWQYQKDPIVTVQKIKMPTKLQILRKYTLTLFKDWSSTKYFGGLFKLFLIER